MSLLGLSPRPKRIPVSSASCAKLQKPNGGSFSRTRMIPIGKFTSLSWRSTSRKPHDPHHPTTTRILPLGSFLTDEHLQRVVRAYQKFKDEPGFTRVVPIEEIRTKEGNLSIPLYVGGETQGQTDAAAESATTALPNALSSWLENSRKVRDSLQTLL